MNPAQIIGLDLSLTATGIATHQGVDVIKSKHVGARRLEQIEDAIALAVGGRTRLAIIEGYSFGSRTGGERLGELGGVIRLMLWREQIPYVEVPPSTLKLFATGKGNASKDEVLAAAVRNGAPVTNNNAADAWWLYQLGCMRHGCSSLDDFAYRQRALNSVDWGDVEEVAS